MDWKVQFFRVIPRRVCIMIMACEVHRVWPYSVASTSVDNYRVCSDTYFWIYFPCCYVDSALTKFEAFNFQSHFLRFHMTKVLYTNVPLPDTNFPNPVTIIVPLQFMTPYCKTSHLDHLIDKQSSRKKTPSYPQLHIHYPSPNTAPDRLVPEAQTGARRRAR